MPSIPKPRVGRWVKLPASPWCVRVVAIPGIENAEIYQLASSDDYASMSPVAAVALCRGLASCSCGGEVRLRSCRHILALAAARWLPPSFKPHMAPLASQLALEFGPRPLADWVDRAEFASLSPSA